MAQTTQFDLPVACETTESYVHSTGISCALTHADGEELFYCGTGRTLCQQCRALVGDQNCAALHHSGTDEAERFGGRYIYFCPLGMGFFAAPIISGGKKAGALIAGPVLVMEPEDLIAGTPILQKLFSEKSLAPVTGLLSTIPRRQPSDLSHLSAILLSAALYISGEHHALLKHRQAQEQYQEIGEHIQQLKVSGQRPSYPLERERVMMQAIREGDLSGARACLNELLGHIFFSSGGDFITMRARSTELMSLLSRAAAEGGADLDYVLELNKRFLRESDYLRSPDDLTVWLNRVIEQYSTLVFDLVDVKHKDIIYRAIHYMKSRFTEKVTLEDVARHVGFTPTYFSRVFKEEMGVTFNHYLGSLRVEHCKVLLADPQYSVGDVCVAAGFDDQSYFTKVFRKYTGVTPGAFRKQQGRIDHKKERGFVGK